MDNLQAVLGTHHQAVEAFVSTARSVPAAQWSRPRAPGKWSPGQVAEHVALSYEVNRGVLHGDPPPMSAPRWLRPLIRKLLLGPVLRRGRFIPGSKSPRVFRPSPAPAPPDQLLGRLSAAMEGFEADTAALETSAIDHPFFGHLPLTDFVRLQEIHTQHHRGQLTPVA